MKTTLQATVDDLYNVPHNGKAEIIDGELRLMAPTGFLPINAGGVIYASLLEDARRTRSGYALPDNAGFIMDPTHRNVFSPDAAFYTGEPTGMKFLEGAPVFAVEVRSESDYGPHADREMARKRADYFAAGTLVVWDVDLLGDEAIKACKADDSKAPIVYCRGEVADAEPAVPGWQMPVDDLFL